MSDSYSPMMEHYLSIKKEYPQAIVFYRLGDFYEMFFEDAKLVSKELNLVLTAKAAGKEKAPMCGIPYHSARSYIERLVAKGYKIAICEQVSPVNKKGLVERKVVEVITPGTYIFEESNETSKLALFLYAPWKSLLMMADILSGEIFYEEIESELSELERFLKDYQAKELLYDKALPKSWIKELEKDREISLTPINQRVEKRDVSSGKKIIEDYFEKELKKPISHLKEPVVFTDLKTMLLDYETKSHLELTSSSSKARNAASLWSTLDQCQSVMGSRLLKSWLEHPLMDLDLIRQRQDGIEQLIKEYLYRDELIEQSKGLADIDKLLYKLSMHSLTVNDFYRFFYSLEKLEKLLELSLKLQAYPEFKQAESVKELLEALSQILCLEEKETRRETQEQQDAARKAEAAGSQSKEKEKTKNASSSSSSLSNSSWIRQGYRKELDELSSLIEHGAEKIAELEESEKERSHLNLKIIRHRSYGYLIEVKNSQLQNKSALDLQKEFGWQPRQSLTTSIRFSAPALEELQNAISQAEEDKTKLEEEIFEEVCDLLTGWKEKIAALSQMAAILDVLASLANTASKYGYIRPEFNEQGIVEIIEGRHPILEQRLNYYVANDWKMEENLTISCITGPNMGGKSTFLKQNALLAIMAQMGSFIPAQSANLPLFDRIFTRIGASDDLLMGQSTFMMEMLEARRALQKATKRSLLLFDEIGRGTSTYDGMALAQAMMEYIADYIGAKTLFSTHYHELTDLEDAFDEINNLHALVRQNGNDLQFEYRIVPGKADKSYGIHVARLAGLNEWILKRAELLQSELEIAQPERDNTLFFMEDNRAADEILSQLKRIDPNEITPREAAQILFDLKKKAEEE